MEQHFYIGTLEIIYHVERALALKNFDRIFLDPVLPTAAQVHVELQWRDALDVTPAGTAQEPKPNLIVWQENGEEGRLYPIGEHPPKLASRLNAAKDRVCITALRSEREQMEKEFRPWFQIHLERVMLYNRALTLHSASIIYRGEAILFTAPSGTGKTTQTDLWHQYREGVADLNGDRTVLQQTGEGWRACGFPIYGSMVRCAQAAVPIRAVVVIRQGEMDKITELSTTEKVAYLYSECTVMRAYPEDVLEAMGLLEEMAAEVRVLKMDCTMEPSAVDTLHQYLYGE
ncbi:MAG: hypothetical protein LUF81_05785 [Clostridiales bacterium]|nr:hypothetical protein [Clostridiales bacterium]